MSDEPVRGRCPILLVTGGTGQIGYELIRALAAHGTVIAPRRAELDLNRPKSIIECVRRVQPTVIVNAAAYTAVDEAESDRAACFAVNATAPSVLAEEALRCGGTLLHYSSDYVFDGTKGAGYVETDAPRPLNVYGESKLAGERAIADVGGSWVVLRTSWVYGLRGRNFLLTILRSAAERQELRVVDDQFGVPNWSRSIAASTARVLAKLLVDAQVGAPGDTVSGLYHLSCTGCTSWFGFAKLILHLASPESSSKLVAIPSVERQSAATRPRWSVLDSGKIEKRFGVTLDSWQSALRIAMADPAMVALRQTVGRVNS